MAVKIQATLPDRFIELRARLHRTVELDGLVDGLPIKHEVAIRNTLALREALRPVLLRRRVQAACRAALLPAVSMTSRRVQAAVANGLAAGQTVRTAKQAAALLQRNTAALSDSLTLAEVQYRRLRELDPCCLSELDGHLLSALDRITIAD